MIAEKTREQYEVLAFSIADTANKLGLSERSVHRLIATGALGSIKAGRRRLIPRESIRQLLTGQAA
jgi:excisionase family DNA binding protein